MPTPLEDLNTEPLDDFEGLSPQQVHQLLHDFLGTGSIVKLSPELDAQQLASSPLPSFLQDLLTRLSVKDIPLTAKGNLPAKLVREWYDEKKLTDWAIEQGVTKLSSEDDYPPAGVVKHLSLILGWTKKRHNKLSITAKGKKARSLSAGSFFREIFRTHLQKFNLGWQDGYHESSALQHVFGYLAYLLLLFGKEERRSAAYCERIRRAFPVLEKHFPGEMLCSAVGTRLFQGFLVYYGLLTYRDDRHWPPVSPAVRATELFHTLFRLDRHAAPPPPPEEEVYERQLRTALFDAEMGSQSYTSDSMPLEMLEAFQQQIRAFEEQQSGKDTVAIRSLLTDLPILPPEDIPDAATAQRENNRLADALREVGIVLHQEDAEELDPFSFYEYLHNILLHYEIVPPPPGTTRVISFSEAFMAQLDPIEALTENFLLSLFRLDVPFPMDILAARMRLNNQQVPRHKGLDHILRWRDQWKQIVGLAFDVIEGPEVAAPSEDQAIQFFMVAYEVMNAATGKKETFEGGGVMEFLLDEGEWRVTGAQFPGFCL